MVSAVVNAGGAGDAMLVYDEDFRVFGTADRSSHSENIEMLECDGLP